MVAIATSSTAGVSSAEPASNTGADEQPSRIKPSPRAAKRARNSAGDPGRLAERRPSSVTASASAIACLPAPGIAVTASTARAVSPRPPAISGIDAIEAGRLASSPVRASSRSSAPPIRHATVSVTRHAAAGSHVPAVGMPNALDPAASAVAARCHRISGSVPRRRCSRRMPNDSTSTSDAAA